MASLQHFDALRLPAALLVLSLLAGCSGDRSRAAGSADTTGTAVVTPDSAAMPVTDTALAASRDSARSVAPSAASDTGVKPTSAAPAAKAPAKAPAAAPRTARDSTNRAAVAAPAPQQQDTSKATTGAADAPLRDTYHQAPRDTVSQAAYSGWKLYNLNCARCHGEDVLGTTVAPHLIVSLKPGGPVATKEVFVQTVCAGRPEKGMPAWCALGLEMGKINEIYEYVKGRSDAKIGPGRPAVRGG